MYFPLGYRARNYDIPEYWFLEWSGVVIVTPVAEDRGGGGRRRRRQAWDAIARDDSEVLEILLLYLKGGNA